ncbi:hypothetical protein BLA9940_00855 [Burkholderia aenigmatica]|uniref:hypothetical protein n=1 Tax=Burkholderia cepacia complex TaxID=87882 RepID=UPI0013DE3DB3|nr:MULTISPECIES: hypothetical protein [Burkholderia cepacia complex]VWC43357.1 hypothetical protein BLA9940_00855 [Burkholderia aenigmatica]
MKILPNKVMHSNWNNQSTISVCNALHFRQILKEKSAVEGLVVHGLWGLARRWTAVQLDDESNL